EFKRLGIRLAESPQNTDVVLRVGLNDVKVVESATYYATLLATFDVTDPAGNSLGRFSIGGEAAHWGRDYRGEEVNATLNHALAQLIANVLQHAELMRALGAG